MVQVPWRNVGQRRQLKTTPERPWDEADFQPRLRPQPPPPIDDGVALPRALFEAIRDEVQVQHYFLLNSTEH
jgi:hypothetical protein